MRRNLCLLLVLTAGAGVPLRLFQRRWLREGLLAARAAGILSNL
jgi:hypothetical protein